MDLLNLGWSVHGEMKASLLNKPSGVNSIGKPLGGIWLSPLSKTGTEWTDFCRMEEMHSFLRGNKIYAVSVRNKHLVEFTSEPSKDEIERVLADDTCRGFYIDDVIMGWDVRTVWVKSLADIEFHSEEEAIKQFLCLQFEEGVDVRLFHDQELLQQMMEKERAYKHMLAEMGCPFSLYSINPTAQNTKVYVTPSARDNHLWQVTIFSGTEPQGHREYESFVEMIDDNAQDWFSQGLWCSKGNSIEIKTVV